MYVHSGVIPFSSVRCLEFLSIFLENVEDLRSRDMTKLNRQYLDREMLTLKLYSLLPSLSDAAAVPDTITSKPWQHQ